MKDLGITLVRQFQTVFGAFIGEKPAVPRFLFEAGVDISDYHRRAANLAEGLKVSAQEAAERGDEAGSLALIRLQLIQEELAELADGIINRDIVECFDALVDLSYVVDGTYITLGLDSLKNEGLREVHRSNMSKIGEDGHPIISSAGRVVKGPNYTRPDLAAVVATFGQQPEEPRSDYISDEQAREMFCTEHDDALPEGRVRVCRGEWVRIPGGYYFDGSAGLLHKETE